MPQTLEIPQANSATLPIPPVSSNTIDAILDRMMQRESSGNANAVGKAGERGLFQIKPATAKQYGVTNPDLLFNPQINRYVAKRYLTDLISHYKGDIGKAIEAYNAGEGNVDKGNVPRSSIAYMAYAMGDPRIQSQPGSVVKTTPSQGGFSLGSLLGEGTAYADDYTGPVLTTRPKTGSLPAERAAGSYTGPVLPAKPPTAAKPEPLLARAADWLPMVGQFGGETLGAIGGAAVPGGGETGLTEYAGAVTGGALGSGAGAAGENAIRKLYGLPPVSVGEQAALGGAGSAVGGLLPLVPRFRKAAKLAQETGISFSEALQKIQAIEAGLERTLGMGARKAKLLESAPAAAAQGAYGAARAKGLQELGKEYENVLRPFATKLTPQTAAKTLEGTAGRKLELAGKSLRRSVEDEFNAEPMTVRRVQRLIGILKGQIRQLNPDTSQVAISAMNDLVKALEADRDAVIGPNAAAAIKNIDQYYARQIARFPLKAVRKATTEMGAAEAILAHKPSEVGRTLTIISEMKRTGQIDVLRRATAAKIFQAAKVGEAANPIARLDALMKVVRKESPEVFDALYGAGARKTWLDTAEALTKRQRELLQHPEQAAAIAAEVKKYLSEPGLLAKLMNHFLTHRAMLGALMMAGGAEFGSKEVVAAGSGLVGIEMYEMVSHSRPALILLQKAATEKNARTTARLIVAALSTAMRGSAESALGGDDASGK